MESLLCTNEDGCGNGTAPSNSHAVSHYTQDSTPFYHTQQHNTPINAIQSTQLGAGHLQDTLDVSQATGYHTEPETVPNSSTGNAICHSYNKSKASQTLLTTEVLQKHNTQEAESSRLPATRFATQHDHITRIEAGAASLGIHLSSSLHSDVTQVYDGMTPMQRFEASPTCNFMRLQRTYHPQHDASSVFEPMQQPNPENMYQETGYEIAIHRDIGDQYAEDIAQDNFTDAVGGREDYTEFLSWNQELHQELVAWRNDLTGIGEHFDGHRYPEYVGSDDIILE